jgi:hypothetical protein
MSIEGAANFLIGAILVGLGFGVLGIVVVFLNNIFAKYWQPISWPASMNAPPPSYIQDVNRTAEPNMHYTTDGVGNIKPSDHYKEEVKK